MEKTLKPSDSDCFMFKSNMAAGSLHNAPIALLNHALTFINLHTLPSEILHRTDQGFRDIY